MKDNTQRSKALVVQALQSLPADFALSEARFHLNSALRKIEHVEQKRARRAEQERVQSEKQWPHLYPQATQGSIREALSAIDEMIADEKRKIEEVGQRRRAKPDDGDDATSLLG